MKIHCKYDTLVPLSAWKDSPFQTNTHTKEQIERLAKILQYQGIRRAATVSNQTGCGVTGHGLVEAIKLNGWTEIPIDRQDFFDLDMERAHVTADNALASWAGLRLDAINSQMGEYDPAFDLEMLGLVDFKLDPSELPAPKPKKPKMCPHCGADVNAPMID